MIHRLLFFFCFPLLALADIPACVGVSFNAGGQLKWSCLIAPQIYVSASHWHAQDGEAITFGDGERATAQGGWKAGRGPWREVNEFGIPFGPWIGEMDIWFGLLDAPVSTPPAAIWDGCPVLGTETFIGVYHEGVGLAEYAAFGTWHDDEIEWQTGLHLSGLVPSPFNDQWLSGAPVFAADGTFVGPLVGANEPLGLLSAHPICWGKTLRPWKFVFGPFADETSVRWIDPLDEWSALTTVDLAAWSPVTTEPEEDGPWRILRGAPLANRLQAWKLTK